MEDKVIGGKICNITFTKKQYYTNSEFLVVQTILRTRNCRRCFSGCIFVSRHALERTVWRKSQCVERKAHNSGILCGFSSCNVRLIG